MLTFEKMLPKNIKLEKSWEYYYKKLQKFEKENGHCNVPFEWENDPELAYWTIVQRTSKINLTKVHFRLLNQINFDWKFEDTSWEGMYKRLNNYYLKHSHVMIDLKDIENSGLRQWFFKQRWSVNTLGKERKEQLNFFLNKVQGLNFRDVKWDLRYNELIEFKKEHGHCRVPQSYKLNPPLAKWVHNLRRRPEQQNEERIKRLNALEFEFGRWEPTWQEMYQQLIEFKKINGHTSPGAKAYPEIAFWVISQRVLNNKKTLLKERKKLLNQLDFDWKPMQSRWIKQFEGLKKLYIQYKKKIPYQIIKDLNYENWIYAQRVYFEKGKLTAAQIKLLGSLNIDLHRKPITAWELMFEELIQFKKKFGHFMVFKKEIKKDYKKLAGWLDMQRRYRKQGLLSQERIDTLDSISFIWDGEAVYDRKGIARPRKKRGF